MYFWICWFTRRYRLIIYLTLAVVLTLLGCLPEAFDFPNGHWALAKMTPMRVARVWDVGTVSTLGILLVVLLFAAADLGALAMGEDLKRREMDFLLTRPKPRRYFVWTSWLAGLLELLPLLVFPLLVSIFVLFYMTHALHPGVMIRMSLAILATAVGMYALVYLVSALSGVAQNGLQIAGFVIFLYAGLKFARGDSGFYFGYSIRFYGAFDWFESSNQLFSFANLLILIGVMLVLPLIVQAGFERKDL